MLEVLSQDLVEKILNDTGASDGSVATHLFDGITRRFDFKVKKKSEFNLNLFEDLFAFFRKKIEGDVKSEYDRTAIFKAGEVIARDMKNYEFREKGILCRFTSPNMTQPFGVLFGYQTFFKIYDSYLGGIQSASLIQRKNLTSIENAVFESFARRMMNYLRDALAVVLAVEVDFKDMIPGESGEAFDDNMWLVGESFLEGLAGVPAYSVCLPQEYLGLVQLQQDASSSGSMGVSDPLWNEAVSNAISTQQVDLLVYLGSTQISFQQSISLKVGDVIPWNKNDTQIVMLIENQPRIIGTIGVVEQNFAVRVDTILNEGVSNV